MKKRDVLLLACLFASINALALEGSLESSISLSPSFKYLASDKEKNITEKNFTYDKLSYDAKIVNLNLLEKNLGLDFNLTLKSSRKDAKINDWDNDVNNLAYRDKRDRNHDVMGLLKFKYSSPEFYGLKSETSLKYYVDNFDSIRTRNNKTKDVEDLGRLSEYVNEDGSVDSSGNIYFDTTLKGKVKNVDIDTSLSYKANQFDRFNVDKSYLKTKIDLKSDVNDNNKLEFKHDFDYDLSFSTRLFDPFNPELDEYPDFMGGNYVTKFDNKLYLSYYNLYSNNKENKIGFKFNHDIASLLLAGEHYSNPHTTLYNIHKPKLEVFLEKEIDKSVTINPSFTNEFEIRDTKYLKQGESGKNDRDIWASYKPKLRFETRYKHDFKEDKNKSLDYKNVVGYKIDMTLSPFITGADKLKHTLFTVNNIDFKYDINKENKVDLSFKSNVELPIQDKLIKPINTNLEYTLNYENTSFKNLKLNGELKGELKVVSLFKTFNPETVSTKFGVKLNSDYTIFDKKESKEKLSLLNEFKYDNKTSFNYYLQEKNKSVPTYTDEGAKEGFYKGKLKYVYGHGTLKAIEKLNTLSLNTHLKYEKELNEKTKLKSDVKLDSKLELLAIRLEKKYTYKDKMPEDKVDIEVFDDFNKKVNVGGSIEITPNLEVEHTLRKGLVLNAKLSSNIIFERKVVDKVVDEDRIDNGSYNYIDKEFRFRKLVPKVELNLGYKW